MKILMACLALAFICSCKQETKKPSVAETMKTYTIEQMMDNEAISGGSFSPDNFKILISSNRSGIYNMYTVPTGGGDMTPITQSDSASVFAISYFPNDERMLFRMDGNGDEIFHIYMRDTNGEHTDLTPAEGARATFYGWAEDDNSFFYTSNERNPRNDDVYELDLMTLQPTMVYENSAGYSIGSVSDNKEYLTLEKPINTNDSDLFIYSFADKKLKKINDRQSANSSADFSPDNASLYYTTDDGEEFAYLMRYDIASGNKEKVLQKDWDIWGTSFTENGTYQITYINEDAKNAIEIRNVKTNENVALPSLEDMDISSVAFSDDEKLMRFYAGGSHTPSNLYVYDLATKKQTQLTDVLNNDINGHDLVKAEVIRYSSFDGVEIPAIYYKPCLLYTSPSPRD